MTEQETHDALLRSVMLVPADAGARAAYADWLLDQPGRSAEGDALKRGCMVLLDDDRMAAAALTACVPRPGTPDKRFVRDVARAVADEALTELTVRQRAYLWRLGWRYRRQITRHGGATGLSPHGCRHVVRVAEWLTREGGGECAGS